MTQLDLFTDRKPAFDDAKAGQMLTILQINLAAVPAEVLADCLFHVRTETAKRKVRRLAEGLAGQVISTNEGYVLTSHATKEQYMEAEGRLRSQIRHMARRVLDMRKVWNRRA